MKIMKSGGVKYLSLIMLFGFSGCKSIAEGIGTGFVMICLLIGVPAFILLFVGDILEGIRNKEKGKDLGSDFFPSLIHLVWILLLIVLLIKGCNDYVN